jgi:hypothetical protein
MKSEATRNYNASFGVTSLFTHLFAGVLLATLFVSGIIACKADTAADDSPKRGAEVDAQCSSLTKEKCTGADCEIVGTKCSGTVAYCSKFKNDSAKCPSSCQWSNMSCGQFKPAPTAPIGSPEACRQFKQKVDCPSTCSWNPNTSSCDVIAVVDPNNINCSEILTQLNCVGSCTWSAATNSCQKTSVSPVSPVDPGGVPNPACAQVGLLFCFLTKGCTVKLGLPPVCGSEF